MLLRPKNPKLSILEALNAKPIRLVSAAMESRDDGGGILKVPLRQTKWTGWLFRLPKGASKKFEFDAIGKMVWEQCDGKTSVQQIIRKLAKFCKISPAEAKAGTVKFLEMLGRKGLIGFASKGSGFGVQGSSQGSGFRVQGGSRNNYENGNHPSSFGY